MAVYRCRDNSVDIHFTAAEANARTREQAGNEGSGGPKFRKLSPSMFHPENETQSVPNGCGELISR